MAEKEDETLEKSGSIKEPDLKIVTKEIQQASVDCSFYQDRVSNITRWWHCELDNMGWDGRKWAPDDATPEQRAAVFPWDGASDSRLHIVDTIVREHTRLALTAFWTAKVQCKSIRPFVSGGESSTMQRMLDWRIYTQMKRELMRELPLAYNWKYAAGLAFIGITWEQQRELIYVPISTDMLGQLTQQLGLPDIMDKLLDPDKTYDADLVTILQHMSPVLPTAEARKVLDNLRATGQAQLMISSMRVNKPKWVAKRPLIDVLFPSETSEIQNARWIDEPELVSESELIDRIETDGYDPNFVEEALKHKGTFSAWMNHIGYTSTSANSDRDMIQLHHFIYNRVDFGVPCKYKVIFNEATIGEHNLYAVHRKFEYDHQQYPIVALRRSYFYRQLLSSTGIAEESYTDEWDIKRQQDGLNNRTDLIHAPPMVVPTLRAKAVQSSYGPRGVMTAPRPEQIVWQPLPPMDQTPMLAIQMIESRLDRRYPIMGSAVDPEIKSLYRQSEANDTLSELEMCCEQTVQLMQQYETDQDVQRVAGGQQPWNYSVKDIQGQYTISAAVDINMIDKEQAGMKMDMLAKLLPFREQGMVFNAAAQIVDPDLAAALEDNQTSPVAIQKEKDAEYAAMSQIATGMEPMKPMTAMNQVRLQTIQEIMQQPQFAQKIMGDPVSQKLLENRIQFFQNQIQQYQTNPQIGRALSTTTFPQGGQPQAPVTSQVPAQ